MNSENEIRKTDPMAPDTDKLKSLFLAAPIGIGIVVNRNILDVNNMICEISGYSRSELIGKNALFLYPTVEEYSLVGSEQAKQVSASGVARAESRWRRKDGRIIDVLLTSAPVDRNDLSMGYTITVIDITEKNRAEKKILEQSRILRQMASTLPGILFQFYATKDGNFGFNYISERAGEIFGIDNRLDTFFKKFVAHIPAGYQPGFIQSIKDAVDNVTPWSYVWPFVHDSGKTLWLQGDSNPAATGDRIIFDGVALDITNLIESQKALRESEERYRNLVEMAVDGIVLGSHEMIIMEINSSMEAMTGRSKKDITGRHFSELFTPETLEKTPLKIEQLRKGETVISERAIIRPDNTEILTEIHSRIMPDGSYQSIFRDITESRKLMDKIQKARNLESLGTLAGGLAHDFNNMLAGIIGYIDLARECAVRKSPDCGSYLDKAALISERGKNLTARLMTFARGGDPVLRRGRLEPVIRDYTSSVMKGSDIKLSFGIEDGLWECMFDSVQIGQVLYALTANAREFSPPGSEIRVWAENSLITGGPGIQVRPGRYVRISVTDMGPGIDPLSISHIFDPFYTTKYTGNGLGLSAAYSIVSRHGGMLDVESVPGKGSTFFFYIPADEESAGERPEGKKMMHRGSGRALIMDDESFIREILSHMLSGMGYEVVTAADGTEVLRLLAEQTGSDKFSFVILDLIIPGGMGGRETVEAIRKMNLTIPVFAASGYSGDPVMGAPDKFGFTDSLRKPFSMNDLSDLLNRHQG